MPVIPARPAVEIMLASASATRRDMLRRAGVEASAEASGVDEAAVKKMLSGDAAPAERIAEALAEAKAIAVSGRHPEAIVIGADQVLVCDGQLFDKPADIAGARASLEALSGRTHELTSAVVVVRNGIVSWRHTDRARLSMRPLSGSFIESYLLRVGEAALSSVGAYQLEGLGAQLFTAVEGDFFTILGLPLLPLLGYLREQEVTMT